jgi:uncharacterized protein (PEP-CTERM system associated)
MATTAATKRLSRERSTLKKKLSDTRKLMKLSRQTVRFSAIAGCALLQLSPALQASPKMDLSLTISEFYSDNVGQDETNEDDSFITEVNPGISIADQGAVTDYNLHYDYRFLEYSNDDYERRKEHNLDARINRSEFDNTVKLTADARVFNSEVNTSDSTIGGGITGDSRVQTIAYGAGASYQSGLRQWHDTKLSASVRHTETDNDLTDIDYYQADFTFKEGSRPDNFYWTATGNTFEDTADNSSQLGFGRLGLRFLGDFSVFGQAQYEENVAENSYNFTTSNWGAGVQLQRPNTRIAVAYNKVEKGDNEDFTSVDLSWTPTVRTSLSAYYTYRFFGESYNLDFTHRTSKLRNSLTYRDSVTSFAQEGASSAFGFLVCPQGSADASSCFVPESLNQPLEPGFELVGIQLETIDISEDQTLNRTLNYTSAYSHGKSTITAGFFWNRSKRLNDQDFVDKDYDKELGATLAWAWKIGVRTDFTLSGLYRTTETDTGTPAEILADEYSTRWTLNRKFTQKISGAISYTFLDRDSDALLDSYTEHRIGISGIARF